MVEIRRGLSGTSGSDRLPWLEPVEDEDYGRPSGEPGGGYGGVIVTVIAVLIGITMITAAVVWYRHHRAATADIGGVIHAPAGPYKIKPPETGGLRTDQVGEVASATGAGGEIDGALDLGAVPEQPILQRKAPGQPAPGAQSTVPAANSPAVQPPLPAPALPRTVTAPPVPAAPSAPAAPSKPAVPSAPPPAYGGAIQLGAFSSEAKAKAAWKVLAGRFAFLHDMTMAVVPVQSGDATLYRLRASGGDAPPRLCARLKIAGETCAVVGD